MFNDLDETQKAGLTALLKKAGSGNSAEAMAAQTAIAAELTIPIRKGVLTGNNIAGIFTSTVFDPNARIEYPIDLYRPDNDGQFTAYVIPNQGAIPQRHVEGDYVTVPTFDVGSSIDFLQRYAKEARFDVVGRALEVLEAGFVKKENDDGWHTIMAGAVDRNILVNDSNATAGQFTKRLISLMKLVMRRNAGGNSTSINRGKLTHLYLSPEANEDLRSWTFAEVDDVTRREIYMADDGSINKVFGVNLVDLDELGEGQEYQDYYTNVLGGSMANGDVEVLIGLDLASENAFLQPIRDELQIFPADDLHRQRRAGFYAWRSYGMALMDQRRVLLASL